MFNTKTQRSQRQSLVGISFKRTLLCVLCAFVLNSVALAQEEKLSILPERFELRGPAARQTIVVERVHGGQFSGPAEGAALVSSDPGVIRIELSVAIPVGNGKATITARSGALEAM